MFKLIFLRCKAMTFVKKLNQWVAKAELWILILIVLVMVFMAALQIILRKFFHSGILWGDIFLRQLVLWVSFIGASLATKDNKHINMDLLGRVLKGRWKASAEILVHLFSSFIAYLLMMASWHFVQSEIEFASTVFNNVPSWYFEIIMPIGFGLMSLRFLLNAVFSAEAFFRSEERA